MVIVSSVPGTVSLPNDGYMSIAAIKKLAKDKASSLKNASALSLLSAARKMADVGVKKEDSGELQDAYQQYCQAINLYEAAKTSAEYKAEEAAGKHGAHLHTTVAPRIASVEARLKMLDESRASAAGPSSPPSSTNGLGGSNRPTVTRQDSSGDAPNERSLGGIKERMAKLQTQGMDMTVAKPLSNKRFSHQSTPSTSTTSSILSPTILPPSQPAIHRSSFPPTGVQSAPVDASASTTTDRLPPVDEIQYQPLTPSLPASSPSYATTSFSGAGSAESPLPSPRLGRQATGGTGVSSSPRLSNPPSLATSSRPSSGSFASSTLRPDRTGGAVDISSTFTPNTPSISKFTSSFPTIEDLDSQFSQISVNGLPSLPETTLPIFPSVPTTLPGAKASQVVSPPPSNDFERLRGMAKSSDLSGPNGTPGPTSPPHTGVPTRHRTGSQSQSIRAQLSGGSSSKVPSPLSSSYTSAQTVTSPPPSNVKKPDLKPTNSIQPKLLRSYLDPNINGGLRVLLLDVRSREMFEKERIDHEDIVCIEPTILTRSGLDAAGLEGALVVSPTVEEQRFLKRNHYDLVVLYDESSDQIKTVISVLYNLIWVNNFVKSLRHPPALLVGGLKEWRRQIGMAGLTGTDVTRRASGAESTSRPESELRRPNGPRQAPSRSREGSAAGHVNGYGSSRTPDGTRDRSDSVKSRPVDEADAAEKDRRRKAHVRDGAVFETETSPEPNETAGRAVRKSSLIRPSSSGTISAYIRPMLDNQANGGIYANHVPIAYPSKAISSPDSQSQLPSYPSSTQYANITQPPTVAQPPQASFSHSPLARRRSDYVEQSIFGQSGYSPGTARASIEYPMLSSQHFVQPPPPAASTAMDRQEQRPRHHASLSAAQPPGGTIVIAGKAYPTPPMIPCNYTVSFWSDTQIGMSGLKNLGNTCYMNSVIQCLSATVPFARFFIDGRWKAAVNLHNPLGSNGAVANAFAHLVHDLWQQESTYLSPYPFRKSICGYAPQFSGSDQHDAQEFLSFLLDGLHEDLNRVLRKPALSSPTPEREKELETLAQQISSAQEWQLYRLRDDSLVVDYFQGQFRNRLQCLTCKQTSTTFNSFMYLTLPIPTGRGVTKVTLKQCLDAFVKPETMEKSDAWKCPNCKTLRKAEKQLSLSRLPPVLLIHLKRFSFKGPFTDKLETMVDFPLKDLDLTNYMPSLLPPSMDVQGLAGQRAYGEDDPRRQTPPFKYELYGVVNHFGSLTSGHYTAFIASKGGWIYCDDSRLSQANSQDVVGRPAYILFYRRVKT
ncbi:ubiquitin-specific protease doa4 [Tulasnella sp. 424]|nr:ubiquitin-specific protease doa4 [Tulasnella sp. 424]KAG8965990.1 ubiquitin-specific protease doa4 [Tulasnella sp. 425]